MNDVLGAALLDYHRGELQGELLTETTISEAESLPVNYFFRIIAQMPAIEQKALRHAKGKVLDVGAGAGSHALYLQEKGLEVHAIDISPRAVEVCKERGVKQVSLTDVMELNGKYDTILLLMNGVGICKRLKHLGKLLQHLKKLLTPGGQILTDSSDIIYMFDQNSDGSYDVPLHFDYYGELNFTITYKELKDEFEWLYVDFNTLQRAVLSVGGQCELLHEGENFDYLARITFSV